MKILFEHLEIPQIHALSTYKEKAGYQALEKVLKQMKPEEVITVVSDSGLRGRGGAGFPAGKKWSFVPKDPLKTKYLLCNGDESEPGTFKDRILMEQIPHSVLEGIMIAAYAVDCHKAYIYVRGEYTESIAALEKAIEECHAHHLLGDAILGTHFNLDIHVFRGAGAYICGEETGLISSLEGSKGWPKLKPPFPAIAGFNRQPTVD